MPLLQFKMYRSSVDFLIDAACGTIGGVTGVLTGSPLDVIKTRMQTGAHTHRVGHDAAAVGGHAAVALHTAAQPAAAGAPVLQTTGQATHGVGTGNSISVVPDHVRTGGSGTAPGRVPGLSQAHAGARPLGGAMQCLLHTVRTEGLSALYKGSLVSSLGQAPNNAITFGVYGACMRMLAERRAHTGRSTHRDSNTEMDVYIAGSLSGFVQSVALAPFEHVKVQQQVMVGSHAGHAARLGILECARALTHAHGFFHGLMRGWVATAWRDGPTYGLYFLAYEGTKRAYAKSVRTTEWALSSGTPPPPVSIVYPTWVLLLGGAAAGVVSWFLALPFDVMKSVIQGSPVDTPRERLRMATVARELYAKDGLRAFYRGLGPCLLRAIPVNAVTFLVYDWCLTTMQPVVHESEWYAALR